MKRPIYILALLSASALSLAQMPWPMERHDRWGSGAATIGPDTRSLTTPWVLTRLSTTGLVSHGPALVSASVGYYGDWINNKVYKFNPTTGAIYSFFQASDFVQCSPAVGLDGAVYFHTYSGGNPPGRLYSLSPTTMDYNWFYDTNASPIDDFHAASPTIGPDGDIVMPSTNGSCVRLHPNGTIVWNATGLGSAHGTVVFSRDDTLVFVSNGNSMTALNYSTGAVAWSHDYGSMVSPPGVSPFGSLFFGTQAGFLYKVNAATGATSYSKQLLGEIHYAPAFSSGGSSVYYVDNSGRLYSIRHSDGLKNWDYLLAAQSITNAPILGRDGRAYIFNRVGDLASVSTTGQEIWKVHLPDNGYGRGTMSIGGDGTLYVGFVSDSIADAGLAIIRQQPQLHTFGTMVENVGNSISGNRNPDTFYSDNHYVIGQPTPGTSTVRYTVTRAFPLTGQAQLWIWLESSATASGVTQTIELWDNNAAAWVQADQQVITTIDALRYIKAPGDFTRFVSPSTGNVIVRITYTGTGDTWQAKIDKATLGNVPAFGW
jgi:hypothetical protein